MGTMGLRLAMFTLIYPQTAFVDIFGLQSASMQIDDSAKSNLQWT